MNSDRNSPKISSALERLRADRIPHKQTSEFQMKVGPYNFYPGKGTIFMDRDVKARPERGIESFIPRLQTSRWKPARLPRRARRPQYASKSGRLRHPGDNLLRDGRPRPPHSGLIKKEHGEARQCLLVFPAKQIGAGSTQRAPRQPVIVFIQLAAFTIHQRLSSRNAPLPRREIDDGPSRLTLGPKTGRMPSGPAGAAPLHQGKSRP